MSDKDRRLKDGEDQNKKNQAMRRHEETGEVPGEGRHQSDAEKLAKMDRADFDRDLRPHEFAGNNSGPDAPHPARRNAYDLKELHEKLPDFSSADLKNLSILPEGTRLEQGTTYFDLNRPQDGECKARADFVARENNLYLAKTDVDYELWHRLRGHGERVGE